MAATAPVLETRIVIATKVRNEDARENGTEARRRAGMTPIVEAVENQRIENAARTERRRTRIVDAAAIAVPIAIRRSTATDRKSPDNS